MLKGGPEKIQKQHDKGRLTAHKRIGRLFDEGFFPEFGVLCTSNIPGTEDKTPVDSSPYLADRMYGVQDVIHPCETRDYLIRLLNIIRDSKTKEIGRHLLAGWPTKF